MASYEQIRIAETTEAERNFISSLTPEERRDALVQAGRDKHHRSEEQVARDHLDRVLEGIRTRQIRPVAFGPDGEPYATYGQRFYRPDENEPLTSLGRVPGHESLHVFQKGDGTFAFIEHEDLRPWPTDQERLNHQQFEGELDGIRDRKPRWQES